MHTSSITLRKRFFLSLFLLSSLVFSQAGDTEVITHALLMLCNLFYVILPLAIMVSVTLAGFAFAIGHVAGAETRARANVWATNMLIGAVIAGAVTIIAPAVVNILLGGVSLSDTCSEQAYTDYEHNLCVQTCKEDCTSNYNDCIDNCGPNPKPTCLESCDAESEECGDKCDVKCG